MISPGMLAVLYDDRYLKQEEEINVLITELEKTKAELTKLKNNIVNLKKRAAEIVALGENQDECDIHEWYSMSPAPYLAELEGFVEDIAELEEEKNENRNYKRHVYRSSSYHINRRSNHHNSGSNRQGR